MKFESTTIIKFCCVVAEVFQTAYGLRRVCAKLGLRRRKRGLFHQPGFLTLHENHSERYPERSDAEIQWDTERRRERHHPFNRQPRRSHWGSVRRQHQQQRPEAVPHEELFEIRVAGRALCQFQSDQFESCAGESSPDLRMLGEAYGADHL